jgi:hypothetical protein
MEIGGKLLVDEMAPAGLQISRNPATALQAIDRHLESTQMAAFIRNAASIGLGADADSNITPPGGS